MRPSSGNHRARIYMRGRRWLAEGGAVGATARMAAAAQQSGGPLDSIDDVCGASHQQRDSPQARHAPQSPSRVRHAPRHRRVAGAPLSRRFRAQSGLSACAVQGRPALLKTTIPRRARSFLCFCIHSRQHPQHRTQPQTLPIPHGVDPVSVARTLPRDPRAAHLHASAHQP